MKKIILLIVLFLLMPFLAHTAEVTLQWTGVERADGYKVYKGTESRVYVLINPTTALKYVLKDVSPGTYYFAVTAFNEYGESGYSAEVIAVIEDDSSPNMPEGFTGTITYRDGRIITIQEGE